MANHSNCSKSCRLCSKHKFYPEDRTLWSAGQGDLGGEFMDRMSNSSTNSTLSSFSGLSYSPPAMSYDTKSPTTSQYSYDDRYSVPYPPRAETSTAMQRSNSNQGSPSRMTPTSLGWCPNSQLLTLYKFVVKKGKEPYFQLLPEFKVTPDTPDRVHLDPPRNQKKASFPCQFPYSCEGERAFKRPADLERHYKNVHADVDQKDCYYCDYKPCLRSEDPFTRKDHFRDHLRDFHKEDLGCAKGEKSLERKEWFAVQKAWLEERNISTKWWRCPKCLCKVQIEEFGYECLPCKAPCERDRKERIKAIRHNGHAASRNDMDDVQYGAAPTPFMSNCTTCNGTAWIENAARGWDPCPNCQPSTSLDYNLWGDSSYEISYSTY